MFYLIAGVTGAIMGFLMKNSKKNAIVFIIVGILCGIGTAMGLNKVFYLPFITTIGYAILGGWLSSFVLRKVLKK